jgi:PKD repeat protein
MDATSGTLHAALILNPGQVFQNAPGSPCYNGVGQTIVDLPIVANNTSWVLTQQDFTFNQVSSSTFLVFWIENGINGTAVSVGIDDVSLICLESAIDPNFTATEGCDGLFNFTSTNNTTPLGTEVFEWCWDFGDGTFGTGQTTTHTYANEGEYEACLIITDNCNCLEKICKEVKYQKPLSITKTYSEDPNTHLLTFQIAVNNLLTTAVNNVAVTDVLANTLDLVNANGFAVNSNTLTQQVNLPALGSTTLSFTAQRKNSCACTSIENCASAGLSGSSCTPVSSCITVPGIGIPPNAAITSYTQDPVDCFKINFVASTNNPCDTHTWSFGDGTNGTGVNTSHVYTANGTFPVVHTVSNECGTSSVTVTVIIDCIAEFTCPCTGVGSLNIDAGVVSVDPTQVAAGLSVLSTTLSGGQTSQNSYNNTGKCIAIRGNLVIDQNFTLGIDGGEIRMQPGARITVKKGAKLNLNGIVEGNPLNPTTQGIHGCTKMWRSIIVEAGASISMSNNFIQDAEFAVEIKGSNTDVPSLISNGNDFNGNHTGIRINGPVLLPFTFSKNTFEATRPLLPVYSNDINNWNPFYPYVGINIADAGILKIGNKNDPTSENSFLGIRNGILARNVELEVYYATFKKLFGTVLLQSPTGNLEGLGIFARSSPKLTVQQCTFGGEGSNGWRGISVARCNLDAKLNDFYDIGSGIYVYPAGSESFIIEENKFRATLPSLGLTNAIVINGTTSSQQGIIKINNNNPIQIMNGGTGILLTNDPSTMGIAANRRVSNNYIYNTLVGAGISVSSSTKWTIDNNHIFFSGFPNTNIAYGIGAIGIRLDKANRCFVKDNEIRATDGSIIGASMRGIEVKGSKNATLCCNLTDHSRFGNYFMGSCDPTFIRHARQYDHEIGLHCDNIGTTIGDQNWAGNEWLGTYDFLGAYHSGSQSNIESSEFRVESPITTTFWPINRYPDGDDWFMELPGSSLICGVSDALCPNLPPNNAPESPRDLTDNEIKVAKNAYAGPHSYDRITQREAERSLYAEMISNTSLSGQDVEVDQFFNNAHLSVLGQLFEVDRQISLLGVTPPAQTNRKEQIHHLLDSLSQRLQQLDQSYTIAQNASDSSAIQTQKRNCTASAQPLVEEWANLDESSISEVNLATQAIKSLVNAIPSSSDQWVLNQKIVGRIYLETIAIGNFNATTQQLADLSSVAGQCMLQGGDAVLQARALFNIFAAQPWGIDDSDLCDQPSQQRNSNVVLIAEPEKAKIIPNPTIDAFSIFLPKIQTGEALILQIFDVQGVLVKSIQTSNGASVSTHLVPGSYICRIYLNNLPYESLKLIITL